MNVVQVADNQRWAVVTLAAIILLDVISVHTTSATSAPAGPPLSTNACFAYRARNTRGFGALAGDQPVLCARGPAVASALASPGLTTGPGPAPGRSKVTVACEACIGWMSWPVNVWAIGSWMP